MRERFETTWGLAEAGAAGPVNAKGLGNSYGDAAGHSCFAVAGVTPHGKVEVSMTLETGKGDRFENMFLFANAALEFLLKQLS
jgi:nicotinamide mononucleotide (NMN) deamidase PncC